MIDLVLLALLTLAVARMCVLMVDDDITQFIRTWVYAKYGGEHLLFKGATCHWCWSIWFSFPMTALTFSSYPFWHQVLAALAVSFVASKLADG